METSLALLTQSVSNIEITLKEMSVNEQAQWRRIHELKSISDKQTGALQTIKIVGGIIAAAVSVFLTWLGVKS